MRFGIWMQNDLDCDYLYASERGQFETLEEAQGWWVLLARTKRLSEIRDFSGLDILLRNQDLLIPGIVFEALGLDKRRYSKLTLNGDPFYQYNPNWYMSARLMS